MNYPIGRLFDEANLVVERENNVLATMGLIIQSATATTSMGATKNTADHFKKLINRLSED